MSNSSSNAGRGTPGAGRTTNNTSASARRRRGGKAGNAGQRPASTATPAAMAATATTRYGITQERKQADDAQRQLFANQGNQGAPLQAGANTPTSMHATSYTRTNTGPSPPGGGANTSATAGGGAGGQVVQHAHHPLEDEQPTDAVVKLALMDRFTNMETPLENFTRVVDVTTGPNGAEEVEQLLSPASASSSNFEINLAKTEAQVAELFEKFYKDKSPPTTRCGGVDLWLCEEHHSNEMLRETATEFKQALSTARFTKTIGNLSKTNVNAMIGYASALLTINEWVVKILERQTIQNIQEDDESADSEIKGGERVLDLFNFIVSASVHLKIIELVRAEGVLDDYFEEPANDTDETQREYPWTKQGNKYSTRFSQNLAAIGDEEKGLPSQKEVDEFVNLLSKAEYKLSTEVTTAWSFLMNKICKPELYITGQTTANLVGGENFAAELQEQDLMGIFEDWFVDMSKGEQYLHMTPDGQQDSGGAWWIVDDDVNTGTTRTIINAQAMNLALFTEPSKTAHKNYMIEFTMTLKQYNFATSERCLPWPSPTDFVKPDHREYYNYLMKYYAKVQMRAAKFFMLLFKRLQTKQDRTHYEKGLTEAQNYYASQDHCVPQAFKMHSLDAISKRNYGALALAQIFLYNLEEPDAAPALQGMADYLMSFKRVNPFWSLPQVMLFHEKETSKYHQHFDNNQSVVTHVEALHLFECYNRINSTRWALGPQIATQLREMVFVNGRLANTGELLRNYRHMKDFLDTHATEAVAFPADEDKAKEYDKTKKKNKPETRKAMGAQTNGKISDEKIQKCVEFHKTHGKHKNNAITVEGYRIANEKVGGKFKMNLNDARETLNDGPTTVIADMVKDYKGSAQKIKVDAGAEVDISLINGMNAKKFAAWIVLNPSLRVQQKYSRNGRQAQAHRAAIKPDGGEDGAADEQDPAAEEKESTQDQTAAITALGEAMSAAMGKSISEAMEAGFKQQNETMKKGLGLE